jgi:hypothetical protein
MVLHERDDAVQVAARLHTAGFDAEVERERLAGEDDDEDHPWAVVTDAPDFMLEVLAEEYDGWVDHEVPPPVVPPRGEGLLPPMELPDGPRRIKGHFTD